MSSCALWRARLRDRAICRGSVDILLSFAWWVLSSVGAVDGSWAIVGGIPFGRGMASGAGGSEMMVAGFASEWVARLRSCRQAARAGLRHLVLKDSCRAVRACSCVVDQPLARAAAVFL